MANDVFSVVLSFVKPAGDPRQVDDVVDRICGDYRRLFGGGALHDTGLGILHIQRNDPETGNLLTCTEEDRDLAKTALDDLVRTGVVAKYTIGRLQSDDLDIEEMEGSEHELVATFMAMP